MVLNFQFSAEELEMEFEGCTAIGNIGFKGMIQRFSSRYILSGQMTGAWRFQCDRCLKPFDYPIKTDVLTHFTELHATSQNSLVPPEPDTGEPEELVTDHINLQQVLIEQMILQIPMKALCSEDCQGLCPQCGQDLNIRQCDCKPTDIDPRLSKLKDFLKK